MSTQDTTALGQQMLKLGLLTESQLQEDLTRSVTGFSIQVRS